MRPAFTIFHTLTLALFCFGFELNAIQDEPEGEVRFQYKMSLERMAC